MIQTNLNPYINALGPLTELCQISKEACDTLAPMIQAFYSKISGDTSKLKSDA